MIESIGSGLPIVQDRITSNAKANGMLSQQDFLTLMTAQLKNQDPLKPMDNGEFIGQMAQFSTVSGIEQLNTTMSGLSAGIRDFRMSTATNLLGQQVLVPGNLARADENGEIHGMVDLPDDAADVVVSYSDPITGEVLHSQSLGPQSAGLAAFSWADLPPELAASRSALRVGVTALDQNGSVAELGPSVYARVLSARAGADADDITLQIEDYGALNALEIEAFR